MKFRAILVAAVALAAGGCASMSPQECAVTDWRTVGFEDGARGRVAETVGKYRKQCGEHGIAPDLQAYREGRAEGLKQYCTPQRGFDLGSRGGRYHGVCPSQLEYDFVMAYRSGRTLYELHQSVHQVQRDIDARKQELASVEQDMHKAEAELISPETSTEQRIQLLVQTRSLARRQGELEEEVEALQREMAVREAELAQYSAQLAANE